MTCPACGLPLGTNRQCSYCKGIGWKQRGPVMLTLARSLGLAAVVGVAAFWLAGLVCSEDVARIVGPAAGIVAFLLGVIVQVKSRRS